MVGDKFGEWTVLEYHPLIKPGKHWKCLCSCGTEKIIPGTTLRAGRSLMCATCSYAKQHDPRKEIGKRYGKWTVVKFAGKHRGLHKFTMRCDCGNIRDHILTEVRSGSSKQCRRCHNRNISKKHGMHTTSTYKIWQAMKQRCDNKKCKTYDRYGGRGIKYDESWSKFENFMADMGIRPEGLTLDRIDNNGNYQKSNCRWVTHKENCNNRYY